MIKKEDDIISPNSHRQCVFVCHIPRFTKAFVSLSRSISTSQYRTLKNDIFSHFCSLWSKSPSGVNLWGMVLKWLPWCAELIGPRLISCRSHYLSPLPERGKGLMCKGGEKQMHWRLKRTWVLDVPADFYLVALVLTSTWKAGQAGMLQ